MTKQVLIDLAIEYGMIHSTIQFREMNEKQQEAVLRQIKLVAGK
jgi:hypothetical protein